jgi:hypothetical protein
MKKLTILFALLLVVSAFAFGDDGNTSPGFITSPTLSMDTRGSADWDITVTSTNSFTCPYAQQILGLDYHMLSEVLLFSSATDDKVYTCDPDSGAEGDTLDYPWSSPSVFGVAMVSDSSYVFYFDEWSSSDLHIYDAGWSTDTNPVGTSGRGMDFDGSNTWITDGSTGVCRFQLGAGDAFYTLSEPQDNLSGLTTFPFGANTGVMVTTYDDLNFYFYEFDGSSMLYFGSAPVPVSCDNSYGLAYSDTRDSFFWSYRDTGGTHHIDELDITFVETAIEETTWGQIKAM